MATNANKKLRCRTALLTQCLLLGAAFACRTEAAEPASGEQAIRELTQPASELEVGVGDVTQGSYKFGEYNGLQREGAFPILNFDLSGGGLYNSDSLERWSVRGAELGIDTRQLDVDYGQQGKFRIDLGYDQLRHNISDTFQTPYSGAGTDTLLLPAGWLKPIVPQVNAKNLNDRALSPVTGLASAMTPTGQVAPPDAAQSAVVNAIINADVPAFHNYNLYTNRYRWNAGVALNLSRYWQFTAVGTPGAQGRDSAAWRAVIRRPGELGHPARADRHDDRAVRRGLALRQHPRDLRHRVLRVDLPQQRQIDHLE